MVALEQSKAGILLARCSSSGWRDIGSADNSPAGLGTHSVDMLWLGGDGGGVCERKIEQN